MATEPSRLKLSPSAIEPWRLRRLRAGSSETIPLLLEAAEGVCGPTARAGALSRGDQPACSRRRAARGSGHPDPFEAPGGFDWRGHNAGPLPTASGVARCQRHSPRYGTTHPASRHERPGPPTRSTHGLALDARAVEDHAVVRWMDIAARSRREWVRGRLCRGVCGAQRPAVRAFADASTHYCASRRSSACSVCRAAAVRSRFVERVVAREHGGVYRRMMLTVQSRFIWLTIVSSRSLLAALPRGLVRAHGPRSESCT